MIIDCIKIDNLLIILINYLLINLMITQDY
jgi:hypothetical protein